MQNRKTSYIKCTSLTESKLKKGSILVLAEGEFKTNRFFTTTSNRLETRNIPKATTLSAHLWEYQKKHLMNGLI